MLKYDSYVDTVTAALRGLEVTDAGGLSVESETAMAEWCRVTAATKQNNGTIYLIGNGASATMASHMAADVSKNGEVRCLAFNDAALLTAVSNDIAYEDCFALPLRRFAGKGDVLITVSSSGNSPNILKAIETAAEMDLYVITVSGMRPDNRCRRMGTLNFYVPGNTYGVVESSHQLLLHYWLDRYMDGCKQTRF